MIGDNDFDCIPDRIEAVVGFRCWNTCVVGNKRALYLSSFTGTCKWLPQTEFVAECILGNTTFKFHGVPEARCTCGIYAVKTMAALNEYWQSSRIDQKVAGEVYLWGKIVEHTLGYRAEIAYPKMLILPYQILPEDMKDSEWVLEQFAKYRIPLYLQIGTNVHPLWDKEQEWIAEGMDAYVAKRICKYHPPCRSLAIGDRVFYLCSGFGAGIVGDIFLHPSEGEMAELKFTRFYARIPTNEIRWDNCNNRWETSHQGFIYSRGRS